MITTASPFQALSYPTDNFSGFQGGPLNAQKNPVRPLLGHEQYWQTIPIPLTLMNVK